MKFLCDHCKAKYQIADEKVAGKTVRMKCRKCGHLIEVRAAVTETSTAAAASSARPQPVEAQSIAPTPPPASRVAPPKPAPLAATPSAAVPPATKMERGAAPSSALEGAFKSVVQREDERSAPFDMADLSPTDEWYVAINGVPVGPIRVAEVRRKAALGAVSEESLVWQEGLDEWRPLRSFPELAASIREAITSARASRPPSSELRSSLPPPPPRTNVTSPSRAAPPSGPRLGPPRVSNAPAATARSNVVPIMSRLATAEKLDEVLPGRASPVPSAVPPPAPGPSIVPDPFASPPSAAAVAMAASASSSSVKPAAGKKSPPWIALAMVAAALAFGVTAALAIFLRPPPPPSASTVAPPPPPSPPPAAPTVSAATASSVAAADVPAPTAAPAAAAAPAKAKVAFAAPKAPIPSAPPAETPPASAGRTLDLHALTQGAAVSPVDDPAGDSQRAPGQCLSPGQLQQVVGLHQTGLRRACWERNPTAKSTVNVDVLLTVAADGSAQAVSANGDEPSVSKCIENDVRAWRFPAMGCSQKLSIPFKFVRQ